MSKTSWTVARRQMWIALLVGALLLTACQGILPQGKTPEPDAETIVTETCIDGETGAEMTLEEAISLANQSPCTDEGNLTDEAQCNNNTGTWWIDLDIDKPGCLPACVVNVNDKSAEINWRCTGVIPPDTATPPVTEEEPPQSAQVSPLPSPTPDETALWAKYANLDYGFAFRYPQEWSIELLTDQPADPEGAKAAKAVRLTKGTLNILVEFKRADEEATIGPINLGDGTVEEIDTVTLFERDIPRHVLVHDSKDKSVFVGERFADMEFYIQMEDSGDGDYAAAEITPEAHRLFAQIVTSFVRTEAGTAPAFYEDWGSYTSNEIAPGYSFSFRYPEDWDLAEIPAGSATGTGPAAAMVVLTKEPYVLQVQYKPIADESVLVTSDTPESLLSEAGTAWFMSQPVPRFVIVKDEVLQRVLLTYSDDQMLVTVELQDSATAEDTAAADIPAAIRDETDQILASFEINKP